jgi:hypothetical protein
VAGGGMGSWGRGSNCGGRRQAETKEKGRGGRETAAQSPIRPSRTGLVLEVRAVHLEPSPPPCWL